MELLFLGTGSAFTLKNFQTNMLLSDENSNLSLLIDCGSDIRFSLANRGLSYKDIKNIFISHVHGDHVGGLEYIAFCSYFDPTCKKPNLYIPESLIDSLWENTLKGALGTTQGQPKQLSDFFNVKKISTDGEFVVSSLMEDPEDLDHPTSIFFRLKAIPTLHVQDEVSNKPSFGLFFTVGITHSEKQNVFITCDTQFVPKLYDKQYRSADVIVHDCETAPFKTGVHSHITDLLTLPEEIRKKMLMVHYQDNLLEDKELRWTIASNFRGLALKGESISFI